MKKRIGIVSLLLISIFLAGLASVPQRSLGNAGGPDGFGYMWIDSELPNPTVTYSWDDITSTGINIGPHGDDGMFGPFSIGFIFTFYGNPFTEFCIGNNGGITFNTAPCQYIGTSGEHIPSSNPPNNLVSLYWDDLYTGGDIYYETKGMAPNRYLVVQWQDIDHFGGISGTITFQLILHENTNILRFQYQDTVFGSVSIDNGASAVVGIEDSTGSNGLEYSYFSAVITDNLAIVFFPPGGGSAGLTVAGTQKAQGNVLPGATNLVMEQLSLSSGFGTITVDAIRIDQTGSGTDLDTSDIRLFDDVNDNGNLDIGTDGLLDTTTFSGKTLTFSPLSIQVVSGTDEHILIIFNVTGSATLGKTLNMTLADETYVSVVAPSTVSSANFPVRSGTVTISNVITGSITGVVLDEKNDPIEDVQVELFDSSDNSIASKQTDSDGKFEFKNIDAESGYFIKIKAAGYKTETVDGIDVIAGQTIDLGDIELHTNGLISGQVLKPDKSPLEGALVQLERDGDVVASMRTNSGGEYEFEGLGYGDYTIKVTAKDFENKTIGPITIGPGNLEAINNNIDMKPAGQGGGVGEFFSNYWWLILLVVVIVVVLVVVKVLMGRRGKRPATAPPGYPGAAPYVPPGQHGYQQGQPPIQPQPGGQYQPPPPPPSAR